MPCFGRALWQEDFAGGDRITTTFGVEVTAGTMGWKLVNEASITWTDTEVMSCTTIINPSFAIYLPAVMRNYPAPPDLHIVSLVVEPDAPSVGQPVTITLVVRNAGGMPADPFWVDLYDNPDPPPTHANQPFDTLCSGDPADCYGIAWYVADGLEPGAEVTLTSVGGVPGRLFPLAGLLCLQRPAPGLWVCRFVE